VKREEGIASITVKALTDENDAMQMAFPCWSGIHKT
jgi:hypothetical protein